MRNVFGPGLLVVCAGAMWGLYWVPLRRVQDVVQAGPWITFIAVLIGSLILLPWGWRGRRRLREAGTRSLLSLALGGASFVLYSDGLLYGKVAVVILLFYLTPIWSTLIQRFWLQRSVSGWRYAAIVFGLIGIGLVLHGSHGSIPLPRTLGDGLGLVSGILWAVASTGIYEHGNSGPAESNFCFCAGGAVAGFAVALALGWGTVSWPGAGNMAEGWLWMLFLGGLWWAASLSGFMWAAQRLEPPRIGILLMSEVIVGSVSAALFAQEPFGGLMGLGGAILVVAASLLETVPRSRV
ncbi:MAG: DMT family transporter [Desulfohalobiaceae bacterium]